MILPHQIGSTNKEDDGVFEQKENLPHECVWENNVANNISYKHKGSGTGNNPASTFVTAAKNLPAIEEIISSYNNGEADKE